MAMQAESLEILERADVPPGQARAIVRAIEIEISGAQHTLATKQDIHDVRSEIHSSASSIVRQMYMAILGQMAVLLGFAYFFATHLR